jgi:hypothetical protein
MLGAVLFAEDSPIDILGGWGGGGRSAVDYRRIAVPNVGYREMHREPDYRGVQLADEETVTGRLQRSLRWRPITTAVERCYGIRDNLLLAMVMQESYGNPIQPNMKMDGGLGLMHMQPVVANGFGLKVYGDRHVLASRRYGRGLAEMLRSHNWDMRGIIPHDDRIHPVRNIDCGGRIVMTGHQKHDRWDLAAEYYFAPGYVGKGLGWGY